ncbi:aKG-HExxH-type peptide beta-hydroxylase [Nonomuraea sp. NPDC050451]|uniref:aKG-HExxH-type peptide beta-hydroxylase n=1 Tax=Nonomuraea sp. NPDC050451 TaxID=3364364 RepID=UPI0037A0D667
MGTESPTDLACAEMLRMWPTVADHRVATADRILTAARPLLGDAPDIAEPAAAPRYALLHHMLLTLQAAAKDERSDLVKAAGRLLDEAGTVPADRIRTVTAADCSSFSMTGMSDPVHVVPPSATATDQAGFDLAGALKAVRAAGFGPLIERATGVIIDLGARAEYASPVSFTLSFLPATMGIEWSSDPVEVGESMVHEAAHTWLNECFDAQGINVPAGPLIYSPWKDADRPPKGIIHAAFAFSTVVRYLSAAGESRDVADRHVRRISAEKRIIDRHRASVESAIAMMPDGDTRNMVLSQLDIALSVE